MELGSNNLFDDKKVSIFLLKFTKEKKLELENIFILLQPEVLQKNYT